MSEEHSAPTSVLQRVAGVIAAPAGADFFRRSVSEIASVLGLPYVLVGSLTGSSNARVETLAVWSQDDFAPNLEYLLAGTPSADVAAGGVVHYATGVATLFTQDHALARLRAESYVGVPLLDVDGEPIGVLIAIGDRPMPDATLALTVLRIFAARIAAELERRAAERALTDSEMRYRLLIEDSFDLAAEFDGERYSYVSQKYAEVLGYDAEELLGSSMFDLMHPEDRLAVQTEVQTMLAERRSARYSYRARHHDGSWRWFESVARAFPIPGSYRTTAFSRDVTDQHDAEDALRDSEARFRSLLDDLHVGLVVEDASGKILTFNREARSLLGAGADDAVGVTAEHPRWRAFGEDGTPLPKDDYPGPRAIRTKQIVRDVVFGFERPSIGDRVWLLVNADPRMDAQGEIQEVVITFIDITASMLARSEIEQSNATARALLNAPEQSAVLVDEAGVVRALNSTAEARFGLYAEHQGIDVSRGFVGLCVYDVFPRDTREQRRARNEEVLRTGMRARYVDERNGSWTDNTIDPICDASGNVSGLAIFSRDISDVKRVEEQLRAHSDELEQLNGHLASTMSDLARSQQELREKTEQLEHLLEAERGRARIDALTVTLNHGAITEVLRDQLDWDASCGVAVVDVDGMKAVNDTFGHQSGDALLRAVARALSQPGAIVGRYGGDEFLVVLPDCGTSGLARYEANARAAVADAHVADPETGAMVPVVVSIGTALYPDDGDSLVSLVESADVAMYREKRERRQTAAPSLSSTRSMADESAARLVGELVPLLTSAGTVDAKLRLVAHHLSVECAYDGVSFDVYGNIQGRTVAQNTFAKAPQELIEQWREQQQSDGEGPVGRILSETHKPVLIDDIEHSDLVQDEQRKLLLTVGIRSGIVVPLLWQDAVIGTMSVGSKQLAAFGQREAQFMIAVASQVTAIIRLAELVDRLEGSTSRLSTSREDMVMLLASVAERDLHGATRHLTRVRELSEALAMELGYGAEFAYELGLAAALHDVGKLRTGPRAVPATQEGPAPLEDDADGEHCLRGAELLSANDALALAAEVANAHHERWDGLGYPAGLARDDIPLAAAVVSVADALENMMCATPAELPRDAVEKIRAASGTRFSPSVVEALVRLLEHGQLAAIVDAASLESAA